MLNEMRFPAIILVMAYVFGLAPTRAEEPVHFADSVLKEAVEDALWVTDPTPTDMLGLTSLSISPGHISSLIGMEHAVNLQRLEITHNDFSDVSPLASLYSLRTLILNNNKIDNIVALSKLTTLEYLDIHENRAISDISALSGLIHLEVLVLRRNEISHVSALSHLTKLRTLDLTDNKLTELSALSGLTSLRTLDASVNHITEIPSGFTLESLRTLDLKNNGIKAFSGAFGLNNLDTLDLSNNDIESVGTLSGLGSLTTLDLGNNSISSISGLSGLGTLESLDLHMNNIADIAPLASLTALTSLQLQSNPLNEDAHNVYVPQIVANNPGINLQYDARQECILSVSSTPGGSVATPGEGLFAYDYGDSVLVRAEASAGFMFAGWSGAFTFDANPFSFTMARDLEIRAHFLSTLDVIYVDDNAPEDAGPNDSTIGDPAEDGTPGHPFDSIQEAIDVADRDVTVLVRSGTYYETIDLLGKSITLTGLDLNDLNISPLPIIDAAGQGPAVTFARGEDPNCSLTGFVVTRGHGHPAAAVYCKASSPTIANCLIVGNRSSDPNGATVYCQESHPALVNCTIADNDNGRTGAGLWAQGSSVAVVNSILWDNGPSEIQLDGHSDISIAYSDVAGGCSGVGNVDVAPLFARRGHWAEAEDPDTAVAPVKAESVWVNGDYHLLSQTGRWDPLSHFWFEDDATSPCIDAGDPNSPVDNEPAPNGGVINLGVFGGTGQASHSAGEGTGTPQP